MPRTPNSSPQTGTTIPSISSDHYLVLHTVGPEAHGARLDRFLKTRYRKRSREKLQAAIDSGIITVKREDGPGQPSSFAPVGKLKASLQLRAGDEVLVRAERKPEPEVDFGYRTLHEDDAILVLDKPANLPVHPAGRYFYNTLLTHLQTSGLTRPLRGHAEEGAYYLPHRIDKETSGVLVVARSGEICAKLTEQFASRTTEKVYLAIVYGRPEPRFQVDAPLARSERSLIGLKMEVTPLERGGAPSLTDFEVLRTVTRNDGKAERGAREFSLVRCYPKTGRQHQIRVHLAHAGHPIVGDKLYSIPENEALAWFNRDTLTPESHARLLLPRHALHAEALTFAHPVTGVRLRFTAALPPDLVAFLK